MSNITTVGLDLAKNVFQIHAVDAGGAPVLRKRLRRSQVLGFFGGMQRCLVGMEACATAHYWARELIALGHEVRLMPPQYVKTYVKRNKNDAADAEAICEAVGRPSMRFVPVKTVEQQSALLMHRGRELLVRQRTMLVNALRGHLAEFGLVAAQGLHKVSELIAIVRDDNDERVPDIAHQVLRVIAEQIDQLHARISTIEAQISLAQGQCSESTLGHRSRYRTDHRHRHDGNCCEAQRVPQRTGVCRLVGSCASAKFDRRQDPSWRNQQTRR